ncbi:MAG: AEC family transporter [Ruminococcaceae bacterium]|nr:AEC family transporter [Oscillospiraceae bacterium]
MSNFLFSTGAVAPTFIIAFTGYFLKKRGFFSDDFLKQLDRYCFRVAIPCLMVRDIADADITTMFSGQFVLLCFLATTFLFFGLYLICYPFFKDKHFVSSFIQCSSRGSIAIFGVSIAINIYGNAGVTPLMMAIAVPLYNIYTVILFNLKADDGEKALSAAHLKKMLYGVVTNPLIIGIAIGAVFSLAKITIPQIIYKPLSSIAATGTPLALLSLGAGLKFRQIGKRINLTLLSCVLKLIVGPALIIPIAVMMGMREGHLIAIMLMTAAPCTVTAYIMANNMGGDGEFTSGVVMLSTLLSTVTITMWLMVLKGFGLV